MEQARIQSVPAALIAANDAIAGATEHGVMLGILRNTAPVIAAERAALTLSRDLLESGKLALQDKRAERDVLWNGAKAFVLLTRDILKPHLGNHYSETWTAAGFRGSLQLPRSVHKLIVLLETLAAFLVAHPGMQSADLNVTALRAQAVCSGLLTAHNAVTALDVMVRDLLDDRNAKYFMLHKRLRDLVKELSQVMGPLDPRWLAFGLNMPGAQQTPDAPQNVTAVMLKENAAAVKWEKTPRARYYRVQVKVVGVDEDFRHVGKPKDPDFMIEEVPQGAVLELAISAVNNGGEGAWSQVVTVVRSAGLDITECQ